MTDESPAESTCSHSSAWSCDVCAVPEVDDLARRILDLEAENKHLRDFADRVRLERDHAAEVETPTAIAEARIAALEEASNALSHAFNEDRKSDQYTDDEKRGILFASALMRSTLRDMAATPRRQR